MANIGDVLPDTSGWYSIPRTIGAVTVEGLLSIGSVAGRELPLLAGLRPLHATLARSGYEESNFLEQLSVIGRGCPLPDR
jgi:hypothetical protein